MTTIEQVCQRIAALMRSSKQFKGIPTKAYYFDYNEDNPAPCVVVFAPEFPITLAGIGFERQEIRVNVWFVEKSKRKTKTKELYGYYESLRQLLHDNDRLTSTTLAALDEVYYGKVQGGRILFGSRGDYFIDVLEVSILVKLNKTY